MIGRQYLNEQLKKQMMIMGGPPFRKILYPELFSLVVINEFARSSPHSASWSKSRTNLNVGAALPLQCLGLCLIPHRVLVVNSD